MFYTNNELIKKIDEINVIHELKRYEIKQAEYVAELIRKDLVHSVSCLQTKYSIMSSFFKEAQAYLNDKSFLQSYKVLREHFSDDLFHGDNGFEITEIVQRGYDSEVYGWNVVFAKNQKRFVVSFPVYENINEANFVYAHEGKFKLIAIISEGYEKVLKSSYDLKDIAKELDSYLNGGVALL